MFVRWLSTFLPVPSYVDVGVLSGIVFGDDDIFLVMDGGLRASLFALR